jgi:hypothetical protein
MGGTAAITLHFIIDGRQYIKMLRNGSKCARAKDKPLGNALPNRKSCCQLSFLSHIRLLCGWCFSFLLLSYATFKTGTEEGRKDGSGGWGETNGRKGGRRGRGCGKGANEGSRIRRLSADVNAEGPPKNYGSSILGRYLSC